MAIEYIKYGPPTATSRTAIVKTFEDGSVLVRAWRRNCWGEPRGGPGAYTDSRSAAGFKVGFKSYVTLDMMKQGCCPPQLMKDFIMQEGGEMVERDPVVEAMKLHKRGYFGGGG